MKDASVDNAAEVFALICKQLEAAETAFGASLRRLSTLDAEIAELVIARARSSASGDQALSVAAIELQRRMAALRIDDLRRSREAIETECEVLRHKTRRLLRQKIALESALSAALEEKRRRLRNRGA